MTKQKFEILLYSKKGKAGQNNVGRIIIKSKLEAVEKDSRYE